MLSMARKVINSYTIRFLLLIQFATLSRANFNVVSYGAKPDGRTDSTRSLSTAWIAACGSTGSVTIDIPRGIYLINPVMFTGPCKAIKITFQIDGTLIARSGYSGNEHWIMFEHVDGVSISGGTIDGRGQALWACKAAGRSCADGATSIKFSNSKNIMISGLTSMNSELYHIVIDGCQGVTMQGVRVNAPENSPNTDGIHVQTSTGVTIIDAGIGTGDDCISIGPGTTNLWVERVDCGPGHGISIGSLGKDGQEAGVQNVTVKTARFTGTQNGLRIKTWGRPSDGFVKGVIFEHASMQNVRNPIIIDQNYCPDSEGCPNQNSGVKISQVSYNDVQGTSTSEVAVNFDCSATNPCVGIGLQDIKLTYGHGGRPAEASCKHADGTVAGFVVPPSCF